MNLPTFVRSAAAHLAINTSNGSSTLPHAARPPASKLRNCPCVFLTLDVPADGAANTASRVAALPPKISPVFEPGIARPFAFVRLKPVPEAETANSSAALGTSIFALIDPSAFTLTNLPFFPLRAALPSRMTTSICCSTLLHVALPAASTLRKFPSEFSTLVVPADGTANSARGRAASPVKINPRSDPGRRPFAFFTSNPAPERETTKVLAGPSAPSSALTHPSASRDTNSPLLALNVTLPSTTPTTNCSSTTPHVPSLCRYSPFAFFTPEHPITCGRVFAFGRGWVVAATGVDTIGGTSGASDGATSGAAATAARTPSEPRDFLSFSATSSPVTTASKSPALGPPVAPPSAATPRAGPSRSAIRTPAG